MANGVTALVTPPIELAHDREGDSGALIGRCKAGDLEAFDELMQVWGARVLRLAGHLLRRPSDAEDAAQATFLRLYRALDRLDDDRPLWPYLSRITVNVCRDLQQSHARLRRVEVDEDGLTRGAEPESIEPGPERIAVARQQHRRLVRLLGRLTEQERACLVLRELEGHSSAEVAEILGSSQTTVRSHISRGRLKLRRMLTETGELHDD